jgi:hypothetical protein
MTNVLYLGMASDILLPFLLVPDLSTLYVIDTFDYYHTATFAVSGYTLDHQHRQLLNILEKGNDSEFDEEKATKSICSMPYGEAKILKIDQSDNLYPEIATNDYDDKGLFWKVSMLYNNKIVNIIIYYGDFCKTWNSDVNNINHLIISGSVATHLFIDTENSIKNDSYQNKERTTILFKMFQERMIKPFFVYGQQATKSLSYNRFEYDPIKYGKYELNVFTNHANFENGILPLLKLKVKNIDHKTLKVEFEDYETDSEKKKRKSEIITSSSNKKRKIADGKKRSISKKRKSKKSKKRKSKKRKNC